MTDNYTFQRKIFESVGDYGDISHEAPVKLIRNFLTNLPKGLRILDVGCGEGALLSPFVKDHEVYGIDGARNFIKKAREKGIKVTQGNLEHRLPYGSGFFDCVVMHHVLEHLVDTDYILADCNRILKNDGHFLLVVPNVSNPLSFLLLLFDFPPNLSARYRSAHVRDFTIKTIKIALKNNGFEVMRVLGGTSFIPPFYRFTQLVRYIPRLARDVVIFAQKKTEAKYKKVKFDFEGVNLED